MDTVTYAPKLNPRRLASFNPTRPPSPLLGPLAARETRLAPAGPKLAMSRPWDADEQAADRAATRVLNLPDREVSDPPAAVSSASAPVQRLCRGCAREPVRRELQGKGATSETEEIDGHAAAELRALPGSGAPLSSASRAYFEPRFGHDFSAVRIHADAPAAALARGLDARAFTLGQDIVFGAGEYSSATREGRRVLAHELAHVVQQTGSSPRLQRLTNTQHALAKGTCGERNVQWVFSLDKPAPEDGYIVQQIDTSEFVKTCPDRAIGPPAPIPPFWEAWFVKKGDKLDWTTVRDKWTDSNARPPRPGTSGVDFALGAVTFFGKSTTGDLGDFGAAPADPKSAWAPGKAPSSGGLPSTTSKPSWWGSSPIEGPAERAVRDWWDCCDADRTKHTFELETKP